MLTHVTTNSPFPPDSPMYFPVTEREVTFIGKNGRPSSTFTSPDHKMLLRSDPESGAPIALAVVGKNYKVVSNRDLFPYIEKHMLSRIDAQYTRNVTVHDKMSYNGRDCYRDYIFNDIKCDIGEGDVSFRMIVGNSYGNKSVSLLYGAIDGWCDNGCVWGAHEKQAKKHTSGLRLHGLTKWIDNSLEQFARHSGRLMAFEDNKIKPMIEPSMFEHLCHRNLMSTRMAESMRMEMHHEHNKRGSNGLHPSMWHFYSALTNWATHSDVRDTGNDHEANTRIQRSQHVERIIEAANKFVTELA